MRRILVPLLATAALAGQQVRVQAGVSVGERPRFQAFPEPAQFRFELPRFGPRPATGRRQRMPGAVVEVWGDASWARQDEFKAFTRTHLPAFRSAFDVGLSASVGADHIANLMAGDPSARPPLIWSPVWFNATNPWARNPKYFR